jgi:hypothetical protein
MTTIKRTIIYDNDKKISDIEEEIDDSKIFKHMDELFKTTEEMFSKTSSIFDNIRTEIDKTGNKKYYYTSKYETYTIISFKEDIKKIIQYIRNFFKK